MKKKLSILFAIFAVIFCLAASATFFPDIIVTSPDGIWTDTRAYSNLSTAITAIGANNRDVYIVREETVTTLVIPANVRLHFLKSGAIANSNTLTINTRNIHADHQIFTGAGAINFTSGSEVRTRWFEDFETAITQTANDIVTLTVDTTDTLANSAAVGDNVLLKWNSLNLITVAAGQTLSNIGDISAPDIRLFVVSGSIAFKTPSPLAAVRACWLGSTLATLDIADNAAAAAGKQLIITPGDWVIDDSVTLASNVSVLQNADLQIATTKTLTINGMINAGIYQIFSLTGTGKVKFGKGTIQEVCPEWWGAQVGGSVDCNAAFTAALATNLPIKCVEGVYKIVGPLYPGEGGIYGVGYGVTYNADPALSHHSTTLYFYNCTDTTIGAINTLSTTAKGGFFRLSNLRISASSWDGTTGCLGYGLDIQAPVLVDNVYVSGFKKSNIWIHQNVAGDAQPSQSRWGNVVSTYSGQHGCFVGNGGQCQTFINYQGKWNGAPTFETAPSVAGNYDGFFIDQDSDGGAYAALLPENLTIIGGDCSYNSRYGWYFRGVRNSATINPGYAEGNLKDGIHEVAVGANLQHCTVNFADQSVSTVDLVSVYGTYSEQLQIWAGGEFVPYYQDWSLSQRGAIVGAANPTNSNMVVGGANNLTGKFVLGPFGGGHLRLGSGTYGTIDCLSNVVALPYVKYQYLEQPRTITGIAAHGTLIQLTFANDYNFNNAGDTGPRVVVTGVVGVPTANGVFTMTRTGAGVYDLDNSVYSVYPTRANLTTYAMNVGVTWSTGTSIWKVVENGTTAAAAPSIVGKVVGDTVLDGTVRWKCVSLTLLGAATPTAQKCYQISHGSAEPVAGKWARGDTVINIDPLTIAVHKWICTVPGTFGVDAVTFGTVDVTP